MTVDIHCHLPYLTYNEIKNVNSHADRPEIIISSCTYLFEYKMIKNMPNIEISVGVHPQAVDFDSEKCIDFFESLPVILKDYKISAIGEIGYDLHPANRTIEDQEYFFLKQLEFAKKFSFPVIIHCRNAFEKLFESLEKTSFDLPVIFHGYSGGFKYLDTIKKKGYIVSFGLPLTYENSSKLRRIVDMLPMEQILTETDSPFCCSYRGQERSFPFMVKNVTKKIAEIKNMYFKEVEQKITENARLIFHEKSR